MLQLETELVDTDADEYPIDHWVCEEHTEKACCGEGLNPDDPIEDAHLRNGKFPCVVCMELKFCTVCGEPIG